MTGGVSIDANELSNKRRRKNVNNNNNNRVDDNSHPL